MTKMRTTLTTMLSIYSLTVTMFNFSKLKLRITTGYVRNVSSSLRTYASYCIFCFRVKPKVRTVQLYTYAYSTVYLGAVT